jgi:hypothetical protein
MEYMFAFARQYTHVVPFLEIDDTDRARLAADRLGQRVRRRHRRHRRRRRPGRSGPGTGGREVRVGYLGLVIVHMDVRPHFCYVVVLSISIRVCCR